MNKLASRITRFRQLIPKRLYQLQLQVQKVSSEAPAKVARFSTTTSRSHSNNISNNTISNTMDTPIYNSIHKKISESLSPTFIELIDDSARHRGHAAMKGVTGGESHFILAIVSDAFKGKTPVARHRMVYEILDEELKVKGVHALSLTTKTLQEYERLK